MWGSEFGGASRRSMGSRMSNQSFDKQSRYSNQSGSRYSRSRHYDPNGSYVKQPGVEPPLATSQPVSSILPPSQDYSGFNQNQSNLMNYFSGNPTEDEVVDVDEALNGPEVVDQGMPDSYLDVPEDNSFESNFPIPVAMDQSDGNDPLPLGDEVSMGVISRESENMSRQESMPMPMPNPNRVQGRRGGRRSAGPPQNGFPRTPTTPTAAPTTTYSAEINHREVRHEKYELPNRSQQRTPNSYRTQL